MKRRVEVRVPKLGLTMESAQLVTWHKERGQSVGVNEVLATLESDKSTFEVDSPESGVVESLLVSEGEDVAVGAVIAVVSVEDID
jgi:pyruvate/2-oxoglutarate dehydrogenase complex dihydrolipoamide acyltransferase (E2) component